MTTERLKLYLLTHKSGEGGYDEFAGFVVAAGLPETARQMAQEYSQNAGGCETGGSMTRRTPFWTEEDKVDDELLGNTGMVGDDEEGAILREKLHDRSIDVSGLITSQARPTTRKTRVISRSQQVLRIDHEHREPITDTSAEKLLSGIRAAESEGIVDLRLVGFHGRRTRA